MSYKCDNCCALLMACCGVDRVRVSIRVRIRVGIRVRVRGISFLKTVNTLQVALQKHKGGDGPSKHEVHLQRCQESPREHMPHNRGISGHRRYPPKAHLDSLGCKSLSDPNRSIAAG